MTIHSLLLPLFWTTLLISTLSFFSRGFGILLFRILRRKLLRSIVCITMLRSWIMLCRVTGGNWLYIFHHNVRSFNRNYECLSVLLSQITYDIDVLVLRETWFAKGACVEIEGYNNINGYQVLRPDKEGRIRLQNIPLPDMSDVTNSYEICAVEIGPDPANRSSNMIILGVYRPPNSTIISSFASHFEHLMATSVNKTIMLCGDMNIDVLTEGINSEIFNIFYWFNFRPSINVPTRVTDVSATCIDHFGTTNRTSLICLCCLLMFLFCVIVILGRQMDRTFKLNANGSLIIYRMFIAVAV